MVQTCFLGLSILFIVLLHYWGHLQTPRTCKQNLTTITRTCWAVLSPRQQTRAVSRNYKTQTINLYFLVIKLRLQIPLSLLFRCLYVVLSTSWDCQVMLSGFVDQPYLSCCRILFSGYFYTIPTEEHCSPLSAVEGSVEFCVSVSWYNNNYSINNWH